MMIETISDFFIILYIVTHKNATKIKTFFRRYIWFYSSSKTVSFISGKSKNWDNVMPKPVAILCRVFSLGFFVFPCIKLFNVLWVIPESVANLLTVIFCCLHR